MAGQPAVAPAVPATFLEGARAAAPIVIGYLPIAFAFGVLGRTAGLSAAEVGLMSWIVYAGASQFIGVSLLTAGVAAPAIISTTFLVNLRYLLMSTALVPVMRRLPAWQSGWLAYYITDESFAIITSALQRREATAGFLAGVSLTPHITWILFSVAGALAGGLAFNTGALGLDFALPAMFVGLLLPHLRGDERRRRAIAALAAGLATVLLSLALGGSSWSMIVATLVGATAGVVVR